MILDLRYVIRNGIKVLQQKKESVTERHTFYSKVETWCEDKPTYKDKFNNLYKENAKLKELLKEWVEFYPIVLYEYEDTLKTKDIIELREKTVEVLK